jgi:hypothetical protein
MLGMRNESNLSTASSHKRKAVRCAVKKWNPTFLAYSWRQEMGLLAAITILPSSSALAAGPCTPYTGSLAAQDIGTAQVRFLLRKDGGKR